MAHWAYWRKEGTLKVTDMTGQGVRITNLGLDLGGRECCSTLDLCLRATGSLYQALSVTGVPQS